MLQIQSKPCHQESSGPTDWIQDARFDAARTDDPTVILDLSSVHRIDTRELGELIRLHLDVRRDERVLILENLQECVLRVIQHTRLDRLFRIEQHQQF